MILLLLLLVSTAHARFVCDDCDYTWLKKGDVIAVHTSSYRSPTKMPHIPVHQNMPPDCPVPDSKWGDGHGGFRVATKSDYSDPLTMFQRGTNRTLGHVLLGTNMLLSPMLLTVANDTLPRAMCALTMDDRVCRKVRAYDRFKLLGTWYLDGVPSLYSNAERRSIAYALVNETWTQLLQEDGKREDQHRLETFQVGFPLVPGNQPTTESGFVYVWTHYHLRVYYHRRDETYGIVGFEVVPTNPKAVSCDRANEYEATYSASWTYSKSSWDTRAKLYLYHHKHIVQLQFELLTLCFVVMLLLMGLSVSWVRQAIKADEKKELENKQNNGGWKSLGKDVFRAPLNPWLWSAFMGVGAQFLATGLCVGIVAALFSLYVDSAASLVEAIIMTMVATFAVNGFVERVALITCHREYRVITHDGEIKASTVFGLRDVSVGARSSLASYTLGYAIPLTAFLFVEHFLQKADSVAYVGRELVWGLPVLFMGASVIFYTVGVLVGLYVGGKYVIPLAREISHEPRAVPLTKRRHWNMATMGLCIAMVCFSAGALTIGSIFGSIWGMHVYAMYGATLVALIMFAVLCAFGSCIHTFQMARWEDYHWWWRGPFTGASAALLFMAFAAIYLVALSPVESYYAMCVLLVECFLLCTMLFFALFFVCATACLAFLHVQYLNVKMD